MYHLLQFQVLELDSSTDKKEHIFKSAHSMDIFPLVSWSFSNDQLFKKLIKQQNRCFFRLLIENIILTLQGWCSANGIMLNIPKTFLPDVPIEDVAAEETKEDKPEVEKPEDPVVSSWCPKVRRMQLILFLCFAVLMGRLLIKKLPFL